jgi:hypothetical protein
MFNININFQQDNQKCLREGQTITTIQGKQTC